MNNFKNLKIAITDETHLKAVCDVLESMGYEKKFDASSFWDSALCAFAYAMNNHLVTLTNFNVSGDNVVNLSDLLKMRDDMVKANAKSS
ncbi:MAG: hypothetical protein RR231_15060 [Acinetobacter sp.]